nr:aldolase/citrate lyase family protein [Acinetobacter sp. Marseille-Q1620]
MNKHPIGFKQRIKNHENLYGLFCSIGSPVNIEQMALAGYDFIIIDLEHTLFSNTLLEAMILAAKSYDVDILVRVPLQAIHLVNPLLDAGVTGIVFPRIENETQARQAVQACHYAPLGSRGLNSTRLNRYGLDDLTTFVKKAQDDTVVILMIETMLGIQHLDEILQVDGIDVILEGAADLSQSMGLPWQTTHPEVKQQIDKIYQKCLQSEPSFCAIPRQISDIEYWKNQSVHMFVLGDDRSIVRKAHQHYLESYKRA